MLMGNENWPELVALTSIFSVELPGIERELLPGEMLSALPSRSGSVQFVTCGFVLES
jgi:hypothetical protein